MMLKRSVKHPEEIRTAPVLHNRECGKDEMKKEVKDILGV